MELLWMCVTIMLMLINLIALIIHVVHCNAGS